MTSPKPSSMTERLRAERVVPVITIDGPTDMAFSTEDVGRRFALGVGFHLLLESIRTAFAHPFKHSGIQRTGRYTLRSLHKGAIGHHASVAIRARIDAHFEDALLANVVPIARTEWR